jgi:hypothetical protein
MNNAQAAKPVRVWSTTYAILRYLADDDTRTMSQEIDVLLREECQRRDIDPDSLDDQQPHAATQA